MPLNNATDYIVQRILQKGCVPVAGAGISMSCRSNKSDMIHNVQWMTSTLKAELLRLRVERYEKQEHGLVCRKGCSTELKKANHPIDETDLGEATCFFCDVVSAANEERLANLAELYLWEFPLPDDGYESLIKLLRIDEYGDLEPSIAHKVIAKLAREGLLKEVITTNYDCNFEKAYDEIAGKSNVDVIFSLDSYRERGAVSGDVCRLKVFKLNGCAEGFHSNYKSILLTERQLQKWRNREWAADLFRDRLRSRTLFFNGFGSDEPQIHHTLQTVLDEYSDEPSNSEKHLLETPSAPIVAIFEPYPSFHQQQIVKTYAVHHRRNPIEADQLIIRHPEQGSTLPADTLWKNIFEKVFKELLIKSLTLSLSSANASFTSIVPYASTILGQTLTSIENENSKESGQIAPNWLSKLTKICSSDVEEQHPYTSLSKCLCLLNGYNDERYAPVSENTALLSELTMLFYLLHNQCHEHIKFCKIRGMKLSLVESGRETKSFYVTANPSFLIQPGIQEKFTGAIDMVLVLGNAGVYNRPVMQRHLTKDGDNLIPSTTIAIGWKHIFHTDGAVKGMQDVAEIVAHAINSPSHYYYANQPSISRRPYLEEI